MEKRTLSEKDRNLDKIFWFKVIISVITGTTYGILSVTGFMSFLLFFIGSTILSFVFFKKFVCTDDEVEYQSEIFVEGLNVSIPLFILTWTLTHTINQINFADQITNSVLV